MSRHSVDRTGQQFGNLTVLEDSPASGQLRCRCGCGREGLYPRAISKPTYRHRRMCAWCAGSPCVVCGAIVPAKAGRPAATCSPPCAAEHARRRSRAHYQRVKDSDRWQQARAAYLERRRQRAAADPAYAEQLRQQRRAITRRHQAKVNADPARRAAHLARKRRIARQFLDSLRAAGTYGEYLKRHREWYRPLSKEDYQRIYKRRQPPTPS